MFEHYAIAKMADPTGILDAEFHENVFKSERWKIQEGCVIVLKDVTICRPLFLGEEVSTHTLIVTYANIDRVFSVDERIPAIYQKDLDQIIKTQRFPVRTMFQTDIKPQNAPIRQHATVLPNSIPMPSHIAPKTRVDGFEDVDEDELDAILRLAEKKTTYPSLPSEVQEVKITQSTEIIHLEENKEIPVSHSQSTENNSSKISLPSTVNAKRFSDENELIMISSQNDNGKETLNEIISSSSQCKSVMLSIVKESNSGQSKLAWIPAVGPVKPFHFSDDDSSSLVQTNLNVNFPAQITEFFPSLTTKVTKEDNSKPLPLSAAEISPSQDQVLALVENAQWSNSTGNGNSRLSPSKDTSFLSCSPNCDHVSNKREEKSYDDIGWLDD